MRSEKIFNQNKNASMPTMSRPSAKQAIPTMRVTLRAFLFSKSSIGDIDFLAGFLYRL